MTLELGTVVPQRGSESKVKERETEWNKHRDGKVTVRMRAHKKELDAIEDPVKRKREEDNLTAEYRAEVTSEMADNPPEGLLREPKKPSEAKMTDEGALTGKEKRDMFNKHVPGAKDMTEAEFKTFLKGITKGKMASVRPLWAATVRLAYARPELRPRLVPLVTRGGRW